MPVASLAFRRCLSLASFSLCFFSLSRVCGLLFSVFLAALPRRFEASSTVVTDDASSASSPSCSPSPAIRQRTCNRDALLARRGVWTAGEGARRRRASSGRRRSGGLEGDEDDDDDPDERVRTSAMARGGGKRSRNGRFVAEQKRGGRTESGPDEGAGGSDACARTSAEGVNYDAMGPSDGGRTSSALDRDGAPHSALGASGDRDDVPDATLSRVVSSLQTSSSARGVAGEDSWVSRQASDDARHPWRRAKTEEAHAPVSGLRGAAAELFTDIFNMERSLQDSRLFEEDAIRRAREETAAVQRTLENAGKESVGTVELEQEPTERQPQKLQTKQKRAGRCPRTPAGDKPTNIPTVPSLPMADGAPRAPPPAALLSDFSSSLRELLPRRSQGTPAVPRAPSPPQASLSAGNVIDLVDSDDDSERATKDAGAAGAGPDPSGNGGGSGPGAAGHEGDSEARCSLEGVGSSLSNLAPGKIAPTSPISSQSGRVLLLFRCQHGSKLLNAPRNRPLLPAFEGFLSVATSEGWVSEDAQVSDAAFEWDGETIDEDTTPDDLGAEDEDIVDVFFR